MMDQIAEEMMLARGKIKDLCRTIKSNASSIQEEMARIIDFAKWVEENLDDAGHFGVEVHHRTDWKNLPVEIIEINARIQAFQGLRRVVREMEGKGQ